MFEEEKVNEIGITLIALVITIVLLILAGVTIVTLTGDNGLLRKTSESKFITEIQQYNEELGLSIENDYTNNMGNRQNKFNVRRSSYNDENSFTDAMKSNIPSFDTKYANKLEIKEDKLNYIGEDEQEREWTAQVISVAGMLKIDYVYEDGTQAANPYQRIIAEGSCEVESPKIDGYEADHYIVEGTSDKDTYAIVTYYRESQNLEYELLDDGTYTVAGIGTFNGENLVIPKKYNEKSVTQIKNRAFYINNTIKNLLIPNTINQINSEAFAFCSVLEYVNNNAKKIKSNAFYFGSLNKVEIGVDVESIEGWGFRNNSCLDDLTIFSEKLEVNGSQFVNAPLTEIKVNKDNNKYKTIDGVLYSKDGKKLYMYPELKQGNFIIPIEVEEIGYCAFYYNKYISEITIPDTVNVIGNEAFESCSNISVINVNANNIGGSVFYSIPNLDKVIIGRNVKSISGWAFRNNSNLKEINYLGTVEEWNSISKAKDWRVNDNVEQVICSDGIIDI